MRQVAGFDYFEVQFTKDGAVHRRDDVDELVAHVSSAATSDLLVLAHGWNNDMDEARRLYERFLDAARLEMKAAPDGGTAARNLAVLGVLWPSKRFAEEELIAGGGASVQAGPDETQLVGQLEDLKGTFDDPNADRYLEEAKPLIARLEHDEEAQERFAELIRSALSGDQADEEDASSEFFALPAKEVMSRLAIPDLPMGQPPAAGTGGAATLEAVSVPSGEVQGGAAGVFDLVSDMRSAARNLLNFATYYQMKARAGTVGSRGVHEVLRQVRAARPDIKLHLVGHSFGGRLVTAAATGPPDKPALKVDSLALLQAAFSHYGFAEDYDGTSDGLFRSMVTNKVVLGPAIITHTANDRAVGLAYPLASRIARQVAAGLGDETDRYGGIGRNGAQKTPEVVTARLLPAEGVYDFQRGRMYNLRSDDFIRDHSDVTGEEVVHAVVSAIGAT